VGTTDTDYDGPIDDPQCTPDDVAYILNALNTFFTTKLSIDDITGTWAGLRPLVKDASSERTADLSRRHAVAPSATGVVSVTGGKLTTYRKMAADTVDVVVRQLRKGPHRSPTRNLRLRGADGLEALRQPGAAERLNVSGVDAAALAHLVGRYGGEALDVIALVRDDASLAAPLVAGLDYLKAEAIYAVRYEMARTLDDVLSRRTRALLRARDATADAAESVARLIAADLGWSERDIEREVTSFRAAVEHERASAELPITGPPMTRAPMTAAPMTAAPMTARGASTDEAV
jgi:glycerol-3-phosphate dehydrogenase